MEKRALIIEDDEDIIELVSSTISGLGFKVRSITDGMLGLEVARSEEFDLIVLDLMLPSMEGSEICRRIRETNKKVPIVLVTGVNDELHKVMLLELGADDYITKPFSIPELRARVRTILRRSERGQQAADEQTAAETFTYKGMSIDFVKRRVILDGEAVDLTPTEFELLAILVSHPGRPFSRDEINELMYGYEVSGESRSIYSHMNRLRTKIEKDNANPVYIHTIRGIGYAFTDVKE